MAKDTDRDPQPPPPLTASPAMFKPAPVSCPKCGNDNRRLLDIVPEGIYCEICAFAWVPR